MGVRILTDVVDDMAALYCSTTMTAFGPVFDGPDAEGRAQAFLDWLGETKWGTERDARWYTPKQLRDLVDDWIASFEEVTS